MKINVTYMGLLLLGALTACHKNDEPTNDGEQKQPIVFKSFLKEGNTVTPMSRAIGGDLNQGYHLGGAWTDGAYLSSEKIHFYAALAAGSIGTSDIEMRVDGTPKDPNAQRLYWNTDGKKRHTFYAYTANPAETPAGFGLSEVRKFTGTDNVQGVCLLFKQPDDPMKQIDLLTADNSNIVVSAGTTSAVNLYFYHRLSKVSIKVFGTGGANLSNCQAKVTYNNATSPYSGVGNAAWAGLFVVKDAQGEYELSSIGRLDKHPRHSGTWNLGPQFTVSNTQASELDASDAGSMIFIPQPIASDGWASIELEYSIDGSASRNTAKIDLPALGQLYPTKEYALALNLIERSSLLTITSVRLVDWSSQNEIIDNLPGDYSLSLSATKPTDAVIPVAGKEYTVTVNSSRNWTMSKMQNVTVSPISGKKGATEVKIIVSKNRVADNRNVFAVFNTVGTVESMASATWMGTQAKADVEVDMGKGLIWAKGNLVANGANSCVVGEPTDGGLYFQFGSLIGWKGGKTGDGIGRAGKQTGAFYFGTTFSAVNEVAVLPAELPQINDIGTTWYTTFHTNKYYYNDQATPAGSSIHDIGGILLGTWSYVGIGDPCRYYLGGTWRLPSDAEYRAVLTATSEYVPAGTGHWPVGATNSYVKFTLAGNQLQFPVSGYRDQAKNGAIFNEGLGCRYWTSIVESETQAKEIYMERGKAVVVAYSRHAALPIRCVRSK